MKVLVMLEPESSQHGDEEQLERYALGTLADEHASRLEEHLLMCADCRCELARTEAYIASVRQAGARLPAAEPARGRLWVLPRFVPILAAAVLALLVAIGWQFSGRNSAPPLAVHLMTTRGAGGTAQAPAGRSLQLQPDLEGLPVAASDRLEIAGQTGNIVWSGALRPAAVVPGMRPGLYFVRVRHASGELLREYGLEVASR
jgi:anti-sigma factor RsiW